MSDAGGGGAAFDRIARLYDWEHDPFTDDVDVYVALARRFGGPVLELACGTGRLLAPLAAAGLACTGVDSAPSMLARARRRLDAAGLDARLELQRLEGLTLESLYRTILFPLDGLALLLDREAQVAALRAARTHATHDARLVLDVSNGNLRGGDLAEEVLHHLTAPDPDSGRTITKWIVRRPDPAALVDDLLLLYDEVDADGLVRRTTADLRLRWFTRPEVELLLEVAGWRVEETYGDYDLSAFGATSARIFIIAARA